MLSSGRSPRRPSVWTIPRDTLTVLDIALGQQSEVADLGGDEQHGRRIRTSCHASAATDASRRLKGQGSLFLLPEWHYVRRPAGIHGYITTRLMILVSKADRSTARS